MSSLRTEITKTLQRLARRRDSRPSAASLAETVVASDSREGKRYGSYRIVRKIGLGGMGQVYLAMDTRLGRHAALKFLSSQFTSDASMLRRLQEEARTASGLNHPNILTIYDIAEQDGEHFIASEYVDGITLRAAMERGLVTPPAAIEIASQVASALVAAHEAGVVHRDLKPGNIMIRSDGFVKVIDFGLATFSAPSDRSQMSVPETIAGTVEYMSPEQARGDSLDHRSDIWSLGIVLYETLCNRVPFDGETDSHVIVAIMDHPAAPLHSSVPKGVAKILDRALAKNRNQRYQNTREMLADLQSLASVPARVSTLKRFASLPQNRRSVLLPSILGTVVLLAALALWWWPFHGKDAVLGPSWFEPGPAVQVTFNGNVKLSTISPDGHYLAYISRTGNNETLRIRNLQNKTEVQVPPFADNTVGLTFSPDSRSLYYVRVDRSVWGRLFSVSVTGSVPKMMLEDIDGPVTFSPDGKQFAFMRRKDQKRTSMEWIMVASAADTGDEHPIVTKSNTQIGTLAWSPTGKRIAAVIYKQVLNQATRPTIALFERDGAAKGEFTDARLKNINNEAWLHADTLLAFSAAPKETDHIQLYEMSVSGAGVRAMASPELEDGSLAATSDGTTLTAVRRKQTSSIWLAPAAHLEAPTQLIAENDGIDSIAWSSSDGLIFPLHRSGNLNLWEAHPPAAARPLAAARNCVERSPAAVPNSSLVIYSSNCADDFNLWQVDSQTGKRAQITNGWSYDEKPDVTPDGKWIVYTSWPSNTHSIWKIPVGGGNATPLSPMQARNPVVSPDGTKVLCQLRDYYDGRWRIAILSISDGAIQRELPQLPVSKTTVLRWSPDGRAIDFVDEQEAISNIWRQPLDGQVRQLTHFTSDHIYDFAWNRSGTMIACIRGRAESDVVFFHRASLSN
jgi:eukaryotic-like serine/threonine-protein kinase